MTISIHCPKAKTEGTASRWRDLLQGIHAQCGAPCRLSHAIFEGVKYNDHHTSQNHYNINRRLRQTCCDRDAETLQTECRRERQQKVYDLHTCRKGTSAAILRQNLLGISTAAEMEPVLAIWQRYGVGDYAVKPAMAAFHASEVMSRPLRVEMPKTHDCRLHVVARHGLTGRYHLLTSQLLRRLRGLYWS